ncbi:MAG: T9SS type A sorting domain-containing protein, partial [Bacteroidota bacterium]
NANTGYIVGGQHLPGGDGIILKTTDGGRTWTELSCGTTNNLYSVFFPDANNGYAVGDSGTILKTTNGGTTWTKLSTGTTHFFVSVYFTDANTGYVVGEGETILKTTNGGTFVEETISPEQTFIIYPNPANDKISITSNRKLTGETIITIFNMKGEQVMPVRFLHQNVIETDVSLLAKGIYLLKIQTKAAIEIKKLLIQ